MRERKILFRSRIGLLMSVCYLAVAVMILYVGMVSYDRYKEDLIAAEQNELLTMAETVGQSLVNYVKQELNGIDLYCLMLEEDGREPDTERMAEFLRNYLKKKGELYSAAAYVDGNGQITALFGTMEVSADLLDGQENAAICGKALAKEGGYQLYVARKLHLGQGGPYLVCAMNLDEIYKKIVAPVRIGNGGYSIVKDDDLRIIMHHAESQIGMDAVDDRSEKYPELDLEDLTAWVQLQRTQPEGVGMIHSYVWDDPGLSPIERIVAYTTIELPGETWIVNSTIPYKEIEAPLLLMLQRLIGICLVFTGFLSVSVVIITRDLVRSRSQKKEINYLREINEGMELLRHKEEEIQHYQRVQTIGQMSSHIAHEFNNYLTPVMVYAELLEGDEHIGEENRKLVQGILKSTNQAADLSRKLLDFSRQETSVILISINLTEDVEAALHIIQQLAPQKISVEYELASRPLYTRGRKGMVEHILMNLCNNAFHAMEEKGGTLAVHLAPADSGDYIAGVPVIGTESLSDGRWIVLSVRDTGCGMDKEVLDKIFEPFYTTKKRGKGTGLGLSVIHNIMVATGGSIRVATEVGKGTSFYLFFPALQDEETGGVKEEITPKRVWSNTGVSRVVAVDDDQTVLESLRVMARSLGCHCEIFQHPAVVISKIQKHSDYCDLILTDYSMPYMNGVELCELVRKLNPRIRLVLMSGTADMRFEWYLKNAFIDEFILKSDLPKRFPEMLEAFYT